jgi:hypothetical protein
MCTMADLGKHSCTAATDASSCGLIKDTDGNSLCAYIDTCSDPCSACQQCLESVNTGLLAATLPLASAADVRAAFYAWCAAEGYGAAQCVSVADRVQASMAGNLGRRAGAVCSLLGPCSSSASTANCTFIAPAVGVVRPGHLDKCTIEGIAGGRQLDPLGEAATEEEALAAGLCLQDDDCEGAGHVCSTLGNETLVCGCYEGVDSCQHYGTCTSHCEEPGFKSQLEDHNRNVGARGGHCCCCCCVPVS